MDDKWKREMDDEWKRWPWRIASMPRDSAVRWIVRSVSLTILVMVVLNFVVVGPWPWWLSPVVGFASGAYVVADEAGR